MSKIPVYICNRKKCLICRGAICGRTIDKDYAELDENGEPKVGGYVGYEDPGDTWSSFMARFEEVEK